MNITDAVFQISREKHKWNELKTQIQHEIEQRQLGIKNAQDHKEYTNTTLLVGMVSALQFVQKLINKLEEK